MLLCLLWYQHHCRRCCRYHDDGYSYVRDCDGGCGGGDVDDHGCDDEADGDDSDTSSDDDGDDAVDVDRAGGDSEAYAEHDD